jgi:hypothetical protein
MGFYPTKHGSGSQLTSPASGDSITPQRAARSVKVTTEPCTHTRANLLRGNSVALFRSLSPDEIADLTRRRSGASTVDLEPYKNAISQTMSDGGWGSIEIESGDSQRAIKRRTTVAGKEMGKVIKWNRKSSAHRLIYQVINPEHVQRRTRRKRTS